MASTETVSDQFISFFVRSGMPRSTARVLAFLLLCEPRQQTSTSIGKALGLSVGSVHGGITSLLRAGLIIKSRRPPERHAYFELDPAGWQWAIAQRLQALSTAITITEHALRTQPANDRLSAMRDAYQLFADEFKGITTRLSE